jgi:hypothetical protein
MARRGRPRKYRQRKVWDIVEEQERRELERVASYGQKWLENYERYAKALALVAPGTILQDTYDFLFNTIKEVEGPVCFVNCWALVSHLLTRKKIRIEMIPEMPVFTWSWDMIVGISGMSKSLPIRALMNWLKEEIKSYPNDLTDAALKAELVNDPKGFWLVDEAGELLKEFKNPQSSKRGLLLSIADAPEIKISRKGKKKGIAETETVEIKEPALTIVANTTIKDFTKHIDVNEFFSGMLQRWNFCLVDKIVRDDRACEIFIDEDERKKIVQGIKKWIDAVPEGRSYRLSEDAMELYRKWYEKHLSFKAVVKASEEGKEVLLSFKQRQKLNIVRCAMVYQALIDPDTDLIGKTAMQWSIRLAKWRMSNLYALLQNYLFFNQIDEIVKRVRLSLKEAGDRGRTRTELLRYLTNLKNMKQLDEVLTSMAEEGLVYQKGKRWFYKEPPASAEI